MSLFYLDSSALVKRYLTEIGSAWIALLADPAVGNTIILAEITQVEVAAALAARHRARGITRRERDNAIDLLAHHCETAYDLVSSTRDVLDLAIDLTQRHRLRGYDAVQLATALAANAAFAAAGQPGLTFVSADHDLVMAASTEELLSDDPNHHP